MESYGFLWAPLGACGGGDNYLFVMISVQDIAGGAGGVRYSIAVGCLRTSWVPVDSPRVLLDSYGFLGVGLGVSLG